MEKKLIKTILSPLIIRGGWFQNFFGGLVSLLKGMKITFGYFRKPSEVVTQEYPENRATLKMFDRYRMTLTLKHDQNNYHDCTACQFCQKACPNGSIHVGRREKPSVVKQELDFFVWRMDTCTFCNACVIVCPFDCLTMDGDFEASVYDKSLLAFNLTKYAGPTAKALMKTEDPEARKALIEPRDVYFGPIAANGVTLTAMPPLQAKPTQPEAESSK
jgi:NADH-quinone oxidoreductase subunit I